VRCGRVAVAGRREAAPSSSNEARSDRSSYRRLSDPRCWSAVPPRKGDDRAKRVGQRVERISGGSGDQPRADPFKEKSPGNETKKDLRDGGHLIVRAEAELTLQEQQRRNRARDQQQVVKMAAQKRRVQVRLEGPAIQRVKRARANKQRIANVAERLQSSARITRPKPSVRTNFRNKTIGSKYSGAEIIPV